MSRVTQVRNVFQPIYRHRRDYNIYFIRQRACQHNDAQFASFVLAIYIAVSISFNATQETYTRVLKGHIQLARAVFPKGTRGHILDVLARTSLWEIGLNYLHGTGHGVGAFLNVHEGKCLIIP